MLFTNVITQHKSMCINVVMSMRQIFLIPSTCYVRLYGQPALMAKNADKKGGRISGEHCS